MWGIFPLFFLLAAVTTGQLQRQHDYCVVGGGPGGLQMAHFLQQSSRDYVLFEKGDRVGSFYRKYPIHRKLISINKRFTGSSNKEFNLRHDWNSLISDRDDLKMTKYSKEMFPDASVYVDYLNDFADKLKLNVRLNTTINKVAKWKNIFELTDQSARKTLCKFLIIATGISKPNDIRFHGRENTISYEDLSLDLDEFRDQSVLILGRGNSAFEVAQHIQPATSYVHMMARSPVRLAWATHYVGDLRAVNDDLLDTYQLKSLDALFEDDVTKMMLVRSEKDGRVYIDGDEETDDDHDGTDNHATRDGYDRVIRCLGFKFDKSPFDGLEVEIAPHSGGKYPLIKSDYESAQIPGLYFSGTNTHSLDYRKSAGGFIHGFRYTTRTLHRILEWRNHRVKWPSRRFHSPTDLLTHTLKRINEASDLWQMFTVLCDVIIHESTTTWRYLEAYPCSRLHQLATTSGYGDVNDHAAITAVNLEYGGNFTGDGSGDVFGVGRAVSRWQIAHHSHFLHPVLYHYDKGKQHRGTLPLRVHHLMEDFLTKFQTPTSHVQQLRHFVEDVTTRRDQRLFFAAHCFRLAMTTQGGVPESCRHRPVIRSDRIPETHAKFLPLRDLKFALEAS